MPDPDGGDEGDEGEAPANPQLWFLRDPAAMARRLVLAEILGAPAARRRAPRPEPPTPPGERKRG